MRAATLAVLLALSGCAEVDRTMAWLDSKLQASSGEVDRVSALEQRVAALEEKEWIISDEMIEALRDERDTFRSLGYSGSRDTPRGRVAEKTFVNRFR